MLRVEKFGYTPLFSVHDEVVSEVNDRIGPPARGTIDDFTRLMSKVPSWAKGLPISVDTWAGERYRK